MHNLGLCPTRVCAHCRLLQKHFLRRGAELAASRKERRRAVRLALRFLQVRSVGCPGGWGLQGFGLGHELQPLFECACTRLSQPLMHQSFLKGTA